MISFSCYNYKILDKMTYFLVTSVYSEEIWVFCFMFCRAVYSNRNRWRFFWTVVAFNFIAEEASTWALWVDWFRFNLFFFLFHCVREMNVAMMLIQGLVNKW